MYISVRPTLPKSPASTASHASNQILQSEYQKCKQQQNTFQDVSNTTVAQPDVHINIQDLTVNQHVHIILSILNVSGLGEGEIPSLLERARARWKASQDVTHQEDRQRFVAQRPKVSKYWLTVPAAIKSIEPPEPVLPPAGPRIYCGKMI